MTLLKRLEVAHARSGFFAAEAPELAIAERPDEIEICKHAGQLIDGKRPQLLPFVSMVDAVDVGDHEVGACAVVQEVPPHPVQIDIRCARDGGLKGAGQLPDDRLAWQPQARVRASQAVAPARLGGRWIERGQCQQAKVDADGGKKGDEIPAGDRLTRFAFQRDPTGGEHISDRAGDRSRCWPKAS